MPLSLKSSLHRLILFSMALSFWFVFCVTETSAAHRAQPDCRELLGDLMIQPPFRTSTLPEGGPVEIREIIPGVFSFLFNTQSELASTLLRFQEHYESPEFRGRVFQLEEFMSWYQSRPGQNRNYAQEWVGFNFPSYVLNKFTDGEFDPLSKQERWLLDFLKPFIATHQKFYVIATYRRNPRILLAEVLTVRHEIAHSLFYFDDEYRQRVLSLLEGHDLTDLRDLLKNVAGYHESVIDDEINAYLTEPLDRKTLKQKGISMHGLRLLSAQLLALFEKHFSRWLYSQRFNLEEQTSGLRR